MRLVGSAFWKALQADHVKICELIELNSPIQSYRWTTSNVEIVSSGNLYTQFPGQPASGVEESADLGINVIDFVMANSGSAVNAIIRADQLEFSEIIVRRVITNSPDLGTLTIYRGKIGDYSFDRNHLTGQARNIWNGADVQYPHYTYMDNCGWRFGSPGCGIDVTSYTINSISLIGSTNQQLFTAASGTLTQSYAANYFDRGRLTFKTGANSGQIRAVFVHSGNVFTVYNKSPFAVTSGDVVSLFPGCRKRLITDCKSKYNNDKRALAFPYIPLQEQAF